MVVSKKKNISLTKLEMLKCCIKLTLSVSSAQLACDWLTSQGLACSSSSVVVELVGEGWGGWGQR